MSTKGVRIGTGFESPFETQAQAGSYDRWFRAKVQQALDDPRPGLPHDEAMAKLDAMLVCIQDKNTHSSPL